MMLSIDLVLMVRFPFDNKEGRVKWYYSISIACSVISGVLFRFNDKYTLSAGQRGAYSNLAYFQMILIGLYFASIFVSIIYTYKKLSGPGMSKAIRMLVLKRHILTSVVYAISNIYICIAYLSITNDGWFAKLALYN